MDETQAEELEKAAVAEGSVAGLAVRGSIRGKKLDPKGTTDRLGVSPLNSPVSKHPPAVPPGPNDATFAVVLADKNLRVIFFKAGNVHEKKTVHPKLVVFAANGLFFVVVEKKSGWRRLPSGSRLPARTRFSTRPSRSAPCPRPRSTAFANSVRFFSSLYSLLICPFSIAEDPKQNKTRLLVGTDDGMFTTTFGQDRSNIGFSIVTDMPKIIQIDVLESNRCVVFISGMNESFFFLSEDDLFFP